MKQMRNAWYLVVALSLFVATNIIRANTTTVTTATATPVAAVSLSTSIAAYVAAINAAVNRSTYADVYSACLPLSSAAPAGTTDLGVPVVLNWYRASPQDLAGIRDALTNAATRLLMAYKVQCAGFANVYGINAAFTTALLNVNDPAFISNDPDWLEFKNPSSSIYPDSINFYKIFMGLRRRRDFIKAAIDPATLTALTSYVVNTSSPNVNAYNNLIGGTVDYSRLVAALTKPALPTTAPAVGDTVAVRIDVGGTRHFMQAVKNNDGLVLFATGSDPLDASCQFKMAVDFDTFGLQATTADAVYVDAQNVVGSASWLPGKTQKATRLALTGTSFGTTSPSSGKFKLDQIVNTSAPAGSLQTFYMRSINFADSTVGYVKVDLGGDLSVRVVDPGSTLKADGTFAAYKVSDATPFSFVKITDLHRALGAARAMTDVSARTSAYSVLFDGSLIATLDDFLLVVSETQAYLDSCRSDVAPWKTFSDAGGVALMRSLIQKMRSNMVATPVGTTALASSPYTLQNAAVSALEISLNAGMSPTASGVRFADGSSIKNALVVLATADGNMLVVGDNGLVSAVPRDLINPAAQFVAEVDATGNVSFRSPVAGNACLQAGGVSANVQGWLAQARLDVSRASCIRAVAGNPEKFMLTAQGSTLGNYALRNVDSQGYLRAYSDTGMDGFVRSVDPSGSSNALLPNSTIQTVFTLVAVDDFIKQLSALRLEPQDQARATGYMNAVASILTDTHVNLLLQELNLFVSGAVKSKTQWNAWQTAGLDKTLLQWMSTGFKAHTNKAAYSAITSLLSTGYVQGGSTSDTTGLSAGDVVVLRVSGLDNAFLQVQADGTFKQVTGAQYFLDPACQLTIAKNATDASLTEFIFPGLSNFALRAPDIAIPTSGADSLLTDRLAVMSCAKFDALPDSAADFEISPVPVNGRIPPMGEGTSFIVKRYGKEGYLKVGADFFVRFFDGSVTNQVFPPVAASAATKIAYNVITSLQKKLTLLRSVADDTARVAGYKGLLANIVTLGDLTFLLFELQYYIMEPRADQVSYDSFKNAQNPITNLLAQISTAFANSLKQLDPSIPTIASLRTSLATQLVQSIPAAFGKLTTADKVTHLESMFPTVVSAGQATEFLTVFGVTMADRAMFTESILTRMKSLYAAVLLNNFTKVSTKTIAGGTQKELDYWGAQLAADVKFADVLTQLSALSTAMTTTPAGAAIEEASKTQFEAYAAALVQLLPSSLDVERGTAISALESAAYTYLNDRSKNILPLNNLIKAYVKPQNVPASYSAQLDALSSLLKSFTATTSWDGMAKFVSDATSLVNTRVQALDADVARLQGILDDALWSPLVLNQPVVGAGKLRYDAQINALINTVKVPIPYLDLVNNLTSMLDNNAAFAESDITYFIARANQLLSTQASQKDPNAIDAAIKVLTRGSRYQVSAQRPVLDQIISQMGTYRTSLSGATGKTYLQQVNDLKTLLSGLDAQGQSRRLSDVEAQSFFDALQALVDARIDATPSQINNLIAWLSSSVVSTSRLVFNKSGGMTQIQNIISVLQTPLAIADRVASLQKMLQTNPQFADSQLKLDFIEKATALVGPDSRQQAIAEKFDIRTNLTQLLNFAKSNQFAGDTSSKTGAQLLDAIMAQLNAPLSQVLMSPQGFATLRAAFQKLDFASQVAALDRGTAEIVDGTTATAYLTLLSDAVANRISGKDADVARIQKAIQSAMRCPGIVGVTNNIQSLQTASTTLSQPLSFADYALAITTLKSAFPTDISKITSDTKTLIVTYAQKLADNLVSSKDQNARNAIDAVLKGMAFKELDDRSGELLKICDVIENYVQSDQVGQQYTASITALTSQVASLTVAALPAFIKSLTDSVNARAQGVASDYEALKQIIDKVMWNPLVQNETGQPTLKALTALNALLAKPIPATDLIALLQERLSKQTFGADDVAYFMSKAQALVDGRSTITDKAVIDQAISLFSTAGRYQMTSKRSEIDAMVATLQAQQSTFKQQTYVDYTDQVSDMQTRLTALDAKAQAQQLTADDSTAFLSDLEKLVKGRAQGVAADITAFTSWLQGALPQSRFFFVSTGAKEKVTALLAVLAQPVSYVEQYNYLVGLLRDYPHFASTQMTIDFLAKCTYLASDAGKQQAQSEGFDYKQLGDILAFALQNQLAAAKTQLDAIIAQLALPIAGAQAVAPSFNDRLTAQETALASLADSGTNLSAFVTALQGLVASRLDGNDAEVARLSQLLQKAQWNGAIRGSAQSKTLLENIQKCLNDLAKPVLFADVAAYLIELSKLPLSIPDQQDRFIASVTKLLGMKDQATDAVALDPVITATKLVAYNQLQKRTELPPLVSQLDAYRAQISQPSVLSFSQEIADLTARSTSLTAASVDKFLSDLRNVVDERFEAGPDQLQALTTLVTSVSWLNIVRSNAKYTAAVAKLVTEAARVPSIAERIQDLSTTLTGTGQLNDVQQSSFVQKVIQVTSAKSKATPSQLASIIQIINVAMFNQVKDKAQELQDSLTTLTRYQQTVQLTGGLSFADRVKNLQQTLATLTQQGLTDFHQQVNDLFDDRVDALDADITAFKSLLQAAVWNNVVVSLKAAGSSGMSDDFTNWYNTVDAPIDFIVWKQSLATMLTAATLPDILQQQFMFKVGKLVGAISRAKPQDLQDAQALLTQASYNQMSSRKSDLDVAVSKLQAAYNSQSTSSQLSFADSIKALKTKLASLVKGSLQSDVDAFVKSVSDLIDQRVDAVGDDLKTLQTWLLSNEVQNNEGIYFRQGSDSLTRLAGTIMNPVSYGLRVQNLMTLVQNNQTFTDAQKALITAKVQILVNLRAQAAQENYALSDVVKILQFMLDKRLDKATDSAMVASLNNAIYVLQSGSVGTLRPRYGDQIVAVQTALDTLAAAGIPAFVASIKALVDGRADGTQAQITQLHEWLVGPDVQANKVLFFSPQKKTIQTMAATLLTPPLYMDRYSNLRQLLQDYPVFDTTNNITSEFMAKALTLVQERGRAAGEKLDLQYIRDLFTFALQNRLTNDAAATSTLQQYMDALSLPPDQGIATGSSVPFSQRLTDLQTQFGGITQSNFAEFVTALSQLVDSRVDATDADITTLKTWLNSDAVQNNRIVFLQGGLSKITPLIAKIDVPITFAQRVDNLRLLIQNTPTFAPTDQATFFAKVDKLIVERWRAAQENYSIEDVVKLLQFVQVNQFSDKAMTAQANQITTKITALRTAPDQKGPAVAYVTYPARIAALQSQFIQIGSMQQDVSKMNQFVTDLNQLVVDRVDGVDADRASLVTFIRSRVLYHQLVYGIATFEQAFQKHIDGLVAPITFGELYANFKKMLAVGVYTDVHKTLFITKLQAIVNNRGDAAKANIDLNQLGRDITFARINKFSQEVLDDQQRTPPDRNPLIKQIEELSAQLLEAPVATLTSAIAKLNADIASMSPANWAAAGPDQKSGLLSRLRILANNVDATTSQADHNSLENLLLTARAQVFKGDTASIALINQYITTIGTAIAGSASGGGTTGATSPAGATSSGAVAPAASGS